MDAIFNWPVSLRLAIVFLFACTAGSFVNWAVYALAWNRRAISPWTKTPEGAKARSWSDRIPIIGWLFMRREAKLHGRGFWIRPMFIEIALGVGLAWLYNWEIEKQGLSQGQIIFLCNAIRIPGTAAWLSIPLSILHAQFLVHAILILFMTAASFIDIDERMIPDAITVVGTLLGLILMTCLPFGFLPAVDILKNPTNKILTDAILDNNGPFIIQNNSFVTKAITPRAPRSYPGVLKGGPEWRSLAIGLACYWLWCFALMDRRWNGKRGNIFACRLLIARIARHLRQLDMQVLLLLGTIAIPSVWWFGSNNHWAGLLTALIGMIAGGSIIWGVRIAGYIGLRVEAMGFGDVTLMMMIGAFLGWQACLILFFISPFAALVVGIVQLLITRGNMIPFGPFLCMAAVGTILYWATIWNRMSPYFLLGKYIPYTLFCCLISMAAMLNLWRIFKEKVIFRNEVA